MRKKVLFQISLISLGISYAQVGINTSSPNGLFHVDGKGDTNGTINGSDDVVVDANGSVGIGTVSPTSKLHVAGKLKYVDGTQSDGYILTSDANGLASWKPQSIKGLVFANGVGSADIGSLLAGTSIERTNSLSESDFKYMGVSITLSPGSWIITFTATYRADASDSINGNIWWDLSSSTSEHIRVGRVLSTPIGGGSLNNLASVNASYIVEVTLTTTYGIWALAYPRSVAPFIYSGEGTISAMPIGN